MKRFLLYVLAMSAGAVMPLAFAPYDISLFAFISPALLLFVLKNLTPKQAAKAGYCYGLGYFGHGVYWVYFSIHHFAHAPLWLAVIIMLGMVAILALYMASLAYLLNRFFSQHTLSRYVLAFPALWVAIELIRSVLFTGFPWLSLGYSQLGGVLQSWAQLLGVFGLSWGVMLTLGTMVFVCQRVALKEKLIASLLTGLVWLGGFAFSHVDWNEHAGEPIKVALLQGNVPQEIKWMPSFKQKSIDIYRQLTEQHLDADLIVWPETAIPSFYQGVAQHVMPSIRQLAESAQTDIVLGLPVMGATRTEYYNGLLSVRQADQFYFKRHLVPLGEYMPLKPVSSIILDFLQIPLSDFTAGKMEQALLQGAGHPFASSICYEDAFQLSSTVGLPEAAFLVNVSNDAWFGDTIAPYQHMQMAQMRALESGRYLLRATSTGVTAIVNPKGVIERRAPMFTRFGLTGEIQPLKGATPFVNGGRWVLLMLIVFVLFLAVKGRKKGV